MLVIGIDPGVSGGLAAIDTLQTRRDGTKAFKMPDTERDLWLLLADLQPGYALIEKVHASPQMGVTSAFTFGRGLGLLRGLLVATGCRFEDVTPQTWQKRFGLVTKGGTFGDNREKKNRNKARAQEMFPWLKVTHATADALLLAEFAVLTAREKGLMDGKEL